MTFTPISQHLAAALASIEPLKTICRECRTQFVKHHVEQTFCKDCLIVLGKVALDRYDELAEVLR